MKLLKGRRGWMIGAFIGYAVLALAFSAANNVGASQPALGGVGPADFAEPTYSSPIALSNGGSFVWNVNPDDDSVSIIRTDTDVLAGLSIRVGDEPQSIALDPNGLFAYVASAADNSVTVIKVNSTSPFQAAVVARFTTGAEPWNIVISPNGKRVFVANSAQDTISVINSEITGGHPSPTLLGSVDIRNSACNAADPGRHFQPRGMAVTVDNSKLFVTRFLSFTKPGGLQASDDGKEGLVCRFAVDTSGANAAAVLSSPTPITLAAQATGFNDPNGAATKAFPNQLQSIVIRGDRAYLPNIAASPAGPFKFNVDTQAFVNQISGVGAAPVDAGALNLHLGARNPETINGVQKTKLFFANPWAIAFNGSNAYAVSAGSDLLVKLNVEATGALTFTSGLANQTRYIDLHDPTNAATSGANAGKNPLGIVIAPAAGANPAKAYVMNYISRNISVVNLGTDSVAKVIPTTAPPLANTQDEQLQVGKEVFFASRGVFDNGKPNRLSSDGWQNCASCHFAGLTDGVVWSFETGPRKSIALNGTFNPHDPDDERLLNYSAVRDEVQDFDLNTRNVSGPGALATAQVCSDPPAGGANTSTFDPDHGLILGDTDPTKAPCTINNFAKPNSGRTQATVTLPGSSKAWPSLDAMNEWVRFNVRTPNRPLTTTELTNQVGNTSTGGLDQTTINQGRILFFKAGCQTCHGGGKWSNSFKDFASPPPGTEIATEVAGALPPPGGSPAPPAGVTPIGAQFLFNKLQDINSFNLGVPGAGNPIGNNVGATELTQDNKLALGKDHNGDGLGNGYNVPSLLGAWSVPPYYHNGSCETLACVLGNVQHRTVKSTRPDVLSSPADQAKVVTFLQALDADTNPISNLYVKSHDLFLEPSAPIAGDPVTPGANLSVFGPQIDFNALIGKPITVKFTLTKLGSSTPINEQAITVASFTRDFGQEIIKAATFTLPATPGRYVLTVFVDSNNDFPEDREGDNTARREFTVRPVPPDKTAPEVTSAVINNDAAITQVRDVTITFNANDPASPAGQTTSGLDSFCVVRYYYNSIQRRWVEEICNFRSLPIPAANGSFAVPARLPDTVGVAYAFVWVKDKAGNISKEPGFDFINVIPAGERSIGRNDRRVFRVKLTAGQSLSLTVTPTAGDVDTTVFQGITSPVRCDVSAIRNGTTAETVTVPSALCTGTEFQIEVRAVVNSRFSVTTAAALAGLLQPQSSGGAPAAAPADDTPTVAGPPALQAAIDGGAPIRLPAIIR
jgi:DNA-binding beta-propeller fold protein YncE/mono/diheme cytochrome c family protein